MDEKDLQIFLTLADTGNLTRTAEKLYLAQPTLSKRLQNMESELGATLFLRSKQGVTLTPAGEEAQKVIQRTVQDFSTLREQLQLRKNTICGTLRIEASIDYSKYRLPQVLAAYTAQYPDVTLKVSTDHSRDCIKKLQDGKFHLAIVRGEYDWDEGEQVVTFRLKAGRQTGIGKVRVTAASSGDNSASEIEIDVREPNPYVTTSEEHILQPGETVSVKPLKSSGTARLELSSIPPIDLSRRLEYLVRYPHGCIEQITSGAFPQLYLHSIAECDEEMLQDIDRNIKSVLSRLGGYQLSNGAFAYWSGGTSPSEWGTAYAVHFMAEAAKYGYAVDRTTLDRALKYLRGNTFDNPLTLAYAQYVLALAGTPDRGAMNRLRERSAQAGSDARWLLAAAYALDGNRKVAEELTAQTAGTAAPKADPYDGTYNSPERQMAIVLMTQTLLGQREAAFRTALKMSDILKKDKWLSTQSTAWMLNTLANFASTGQTGIDARIGREPIRSAKSIASMPLTAPTEVRNTGTGSLHLVVSQSYTPGKGEEAEAASSLKIDVRYRDMNGAPLDPRSVAVSTDFYAVVTVTNTSGYERYADLALTHIVPAGWEITSERDLSTVTYQDIRDDRVLSYFDLRSGESKEIPIKLTATYKGRYYLPSVCCEAMYDNSVRALRKGEWVEVVGQTPAGN